MRCRSWWRCQQQPAAADTTPVSLVVAELSSPSEKAGLETEVQEDVVANQVGIAVVVGRQDFDAEDYGHHLHHLPPYPSSQRRIQVYVTAGSDAFLLERHCWTQPNHEGQQFSAVLLRKSVAADQTMCALRDAAAFHCQDVASLTFDLEKETDFLARTTVWEHYH